MRDCRHVSFLPANITGRGANKQLTTAIQSKRSPHSLQIGTVGNRRMYKLSAALALTGLVGLAFTNAHESKPVASRSDAQPVIAPMASVSENEEHVRHLRVRRKSEADFQGETQPRLAQGDARAQSAVSIDAAPTGEIKHKKKKPKSISRKQRDITNQEVVNAQSPAEEAQSQKPRGFFEALFSGN